MKTDHQQCDKDIETLGKTDTEIMIYNDRTIAKDLTVYVVIR